MTQEEFEAKYVNQIHCGDWIRIAKGLPADCVHCIVTSPPYWGQRNYGCDGQLGLEKTPEEHIEKLVAGFREIRRILRPDGVLWLNYGDKYWGGKGQSAHGGSEKQKERFERNQSLNKPYQEIGKPGWTAPGDALHDIFKPGDLIGLPWRVALALQADGWWLRSDIVWAKALSFCPTYSGSTMPESVSGTHWEQHRVIRCAKCGTLASFKKCICQKCGWNRSDRQQARIADHFQDHSGNEIKSDLQWADCPGCTKCEKNGGLVLRRGSWRCTKAHEYLFMLTKSERYFCDMEAVKEETSGGTHDPGTKLDKPSEHRDIGHEGWSRSTSELLTHRNLRDVWCINPQAYKGAHYATFPEKLVEPCIKVSTSQKGVCPKCGSQWARVISRGNLVADKPGYKPRGSNRPSEGVKTGLTPAGETQGHPNFHYEQETLGWRATCDCGIQETVPAICYDPFMGSGTVAAVAARLGRNYCGSELSEKYLTEQAIIRVKASEYGMDMAEVQAGQQALFE